MTTGMVITVAKTVFDVLTSDAFKGVCSMFGYKSQLEDLKSTMSAIRAVLVDAELKQDHEPLDHATQDWINKLKDAVYDLDDLLDEFNTFAQRKKLMDANDSKISEKVSRFFSGSSELLVAFKMYIDIKKNKKRLDAIASDRAKYGFNTNYQPRRREETDSFVYKEKIIGRDSEKEDIVRILLDTDVDKRVSFVTIVGMGGLGKTTLSRLVYHDDRIKSKFEKLRLWVCVNENFSMESILKKVLSANNPSCILSPGQLKEKVQEELEGKTYLLILDDVWEESRFKWVELIEFLEFCGKGSKIVVTCRSKNVAKGIGNGIVYELQGLSDDDSWQLFKRMAFGEEAEHVGADFVDIGKDIVKKCSNVPLCVKVIGSFLFGQDTEKWASFQKNDFSKIQKANDVTMETLQFSYFHLTPELKSCFSYCALFPKGHEIKKKDLLDLWMANGCIVLETDEVRCIEDVGEEYFSILLHRCFFQDIVKRYDSEDIVSCKVHDLIHDLALKVAGHDVLMLPSMERHLHEKVRHVSLYTHGCTNYYTLHDCLARITMIRNFHQIGYPHYRPDFMMLISKYRCLRFLNMSYALLKTLPSVIGGLIHLRYLNLSGNDELKMLPESITDLFNLQQLQLSGCQQLQALPMHFSRLVSLRHLDLSYCGGLTIMPRGLKNFTCLQRLTYFVLGGNMMDIQRNQLEGLKALVNLRGKLVITIKELSLNGSAQFRQGTYLLEKQYLNKLKVQFPDDINQKEVQEALLEGLQPHNNLQRLNLRDYQGEKFPIWASPGDALRTYLPRLACIKLIKLPMLNHLPTFSRLSSLKYLLVDDIPNLEYMESDNDEPSADLMFFPSLAVLRLKSLPRLKRWWKDSVTHVDAEEGVEQNHMASSFFIFPCLVTLEIKGCPNMKLLPPCPHVKELDLFKFNELLSFREKGMNLSHLDTGIVGIRIDEDQKRLVMGLERLKIDNIEFLGSLPAEFATVLACLYITDAKGESLCMASESIQRCGLSLEELSFIRCKNLKSLLGGGIERLSCLRNLHIEIAPQLELEDEDGMPWRSLHTLSKLDLWSIDKMKNLPKGIQYLTSLQVLKIWHCRNLRGLPKWLGRCTSLQTLEIWGCEKVKRLPKAMRNLTSLTRLNIAFNKDLINRCQSPNGDDWPKISHIPSIYLDGTRMKV